MINYCVVDTETTGLGTSDRVIEFSAVLIDSETFEVLDEFDTLINPMRDIPARSSEIHGLRASDLSMAPTFEEVGPSIASFLDGAIFVAHNVAFDSRMLGNEFQRIGIELDFGAPFCTLKATKMKLEFALHSLGYRSFDAHHSLADARGTSFLLQRLNPNVVNLEPMKLKSKVAPGVPRTLRRNQMAGTLPARVISPFRFRFPTNEENELAYLYLLNGFLEDGHLDREEIIQLESFAALTGIEHKLQALHQSYLDTVYTAAIRDGVIDSGEAALISKVSELLGCAPKEIAPMEVNQILELEPSIRICFTGSSSNPNLNYTREELHMIAMSYQLIPVDAVTRQGCDLLVVADPSSMSGKARKARDYGIPILSLEEFVLRTCK